MPVAEWFSWELLTPRRRFDPCPAHVTTYTPLTPEAWDSVSAVLDAELASQRAQGHPNMARGIQAAQRRLEVLRPTERSKQHKFQFLTKAEISALSIANLDIPDLARSHIRWHAKVETIGDLEAMTWVDLLTKDYIGIKTVQYVAAALEQAGTGFKPCDRPLPQGK